MRRMDEQNAGGASIRRPACGFVDSQAEAAFDGFARAFRGRELFFFGETLPSSADDCVVHLDADGAMIAALNMGVDEGSF